MRSEGSYVTNKDLLKYIKLFEDELTLDNLPANTLRALCRLLSIQPFGSLEIIRFQLSLKLRALKADDQVKYCKFLTVECRCPFTAASELIFCLKLKAGLFSSFT